MKYYNKNKPDEEYLHICREVLVDTIIGAGNKNNVSHSFWRRNKKDISYRLLWYNIVSHIINGNSTLKTVEELHNFIYYSTKQIKNNKENKWREKNENKNDNTHSR